MLRRIIIFTFITLLSVAGPTYAAPVYMSDEDVDTRLHDVSQILYSQEIDADYWEYGWGTFDAGTMIWSTAQAANEHDRKARGADIVQASESLIGLADVIFRPLPAFNADLACMSQETQGDARKCLAAKEELLERSAERANDPYELLPHLANAGFNLTAGLIIWKVGGGGRALVTAVPGEIIGELQQIGRAHV